MSKKVLIDLLKLRQLENCQVEGVDLNLQGEGAFKTIRELATFKFTCRKCKDAPCIAVCPVEALERDDNDVIKRSSNLCVGCKSCVIACPFGTIMDDVIEYKKPICDFCDLSDNVETLECIKTCPEKAISLVDIDEDKEEDIYRLNDKILIKEHIWEKLQKK